MSSFTIDSMYRGLVVAVTTTSFLAVGLVAQADDEIDVPSAELLADSSPEVDGIAEHFIEGDLSDAIREGHFPDPGDLVSRNEHRLPDNGAVVSVTVHERATTTEVTLSSCTASVTAGNPFRSNQAGRPVTAQLSWTYGSGCQMSSANATGQLQRRNWAYLWLSEASTSQSVPRGQTRTATVTTNCGASGLFRSQGTLTDTLSGGVNVTVRSSRTNITC